MRLEAGDTVAVMGMFRPRPGGVEAQNDCRRLVVRGYRLGQTGFKMVVEQLVIAA